MSDLNKQSKWFLIAVSLLIGVPILAATALLFTSIEVHHWVGRKELDVHVLVVDASSLVPVSNATVQILHGPFSPIEGRLTPNVEDDFTVVELEGDGNPLTTDEYGRTTFAHKFFAAGSRGSSKDSGYVNTHAVWLRVSAPDYPTTFMPLDGQSSRTRNIDDETPIYATVPIGKK